MKKLTLLAAALTCAFAVAACDQNPNSRKQDLSKILEQQKLNNEQNVDSYRFVDTNKKCDTMQRTFRDKLEMCLGLQVESINNSCAIDQRKAFFAEHCEGLEWSPRTAETGLKETNGKYVECILTENGQKPVTQFSSQVTMVMNGQTTRAVIMHGLREGQIALKMDLFSIDDNSQISAARKLFQDETETVVINEGGSPSLACKVTLTNDPRR